MTINWRDLVITDSDGHQFSDSLGELVENSPGNLDNATIRGGIIAEWPQHFISAPGEEPDWDTPRVDVNWDGFVDRLAAIAGWDPDHRNVEAMR